MTAPYRHVGRSDPVSQGETRDPLSGVNSPWGWDQPLPVFGVGAMPLSDPQGADGELIDRDRAVAVLHRAFDLGFTLVDTADIYAPDSQHVGHNEQLVGEAVRTWSGGRDALTVVTKIGVTRRPAPRLGDDEVWGRDGSPGYLLRAAEASVARLGLVPDVIVLHRVNREQQPLTQTIGGMIAVRSAGLARRIGIGNVRLDECQIAWEASEGTIAVVENERSPRYRGDADVLAWCGRHRVAYLAWSPLGGGEDAARLGELYPEFALVANEQTALAGEPVSAQQVALAWLKTAGRQMLPIPAFTRQATAESAARAAHLTLTPDQITRLDASPQGPGSLFPDDED